MWEEGGVCTLGEIVPERFQKVHGVRHEFPEGIEYLEISSF